MLAPPRLIAFLGLLIASPLPLAAQECRLLSTDEHHLSNDFSLTATSAAGAPGEVVAVEISLAIEEFHGRLLSFAFGAVYDESIAEFLGEPDYSESFDGFAHMPMLFDWVEGERTVEDISAGRAAFLFTGLFRGGAEEFFAQGEPVPIGTFYFRLRGSPGDTSAVEFADFTLTFTDHVACVQQQITYDLGDFGDEAGTYYAHALPSLHTAGGLWVVSGEPVQTERPASAPEAIVYHGDRVLNDAAVHFELDGATVQPRARAIPIQVVLTSNLEFTGYLLSGRFPAEFLELSHIVNHGRPGVSSIDNQTGEFWSLSTNARRRMGAEGERVHIATFYVNVKESAAVGQDIYIHLTSIQSGKYRNWLNIRGIDSGVPTDYEAEPIQVTGGLLKIQTQPTILGDVNFDYTLDLADAIALLGDLFRGNAQVICPGAADVNDDAVVTISDPIILLNHLFHGIPLVTPEVYCDRGGA